MKKWNRAWKIELIERFNPGWRDLYDDLEPE
jgi:putative endonuclease